MNLKKPLEEVFMINTYFHIKHSYIKKSDIEHWTIDQTILIQSNQSMYLSQLPEIWIEYIHVLCSGVKLYSFSWKTFVCACTCVTQWKTTVVIPYAWSFHLYDFLKQSLTCLGLSFRLDWIHCQVSTFDYLISTCITSSHMLVLHMASEDGIQFLGFVSKELHAFNYIFWSNFYIKRQ